MATRRHDQARPLRRLYHLHPPPRAALQETMAAQRYGTLGPTLTTHPHHTPDKIANAPAAAHHHKERTAEAKQRLPLRGHPTPPTPS